VGSEMCIRDRKTTKKKYLEFAMKPGKIL